MALEIGLAVLHGSPCGPPHQGSALQCLALLGLRPRLISTRPFGASRATPPSRPRRATARSSLQPPSVRPNRKRSTTKPQIRSTKSETNDKRPSTKPTPPRPPRVPGPAARLSFAVVPFCRLFRILSFGFRAPDSELPVPSAYLNSQPKEPLPKGPKPAEGRLDRLAHACRRNSAAPGARPPLASHRNSPAQSRLD